MTRIRDTTPRRRRGPRRETHMRDVHLRSLAPIAVAAVWLAVIEPAVWTPGATPKSKTRDKVWTHPQYASFGIERIALLPVATFNEDFQAATTTETALGQALRPLGYRWVGAATVRDLLRAEPSGD